MGLFLFSDVADNDRAVVQVFFGELVDEFTSFMGISEYDGIVDLVEGDDGIHGITSFLFFMSLL